ncbi:hypothetical protein [Streptomyces sp. NBC_01744]|uniref:hypothetical protein n=1 Tax=Streptomyces sp. NBC_01744 TaxID=2975927 RepID=UPI003D9A663E|nr:hypothetical protein OIE70_36865 [Streptomyces sp. NBC_01744]
MAKGRALAIVGYSALTLLCAAATTWTVITGLARLDLLGNAVEVRFTECHREGGGRGGSHIVCSGPQLHTTSTHTAKVQYNGHKDETIRAVQKPWGSYEAVDTGLISWGIAALLPVLPLGATATAGAFTVREVRRARWEATAD